jgi:hypothetical protein
MRVNRQVAVLRRKGKRVVKQRLWRTFGGPPIALAGRFRKWGVIGELHEDNKIMCDFDDLEVKRGQKKPKCHTRNKSLPHPNLQSLMHTLGTGVVWQRWDRTKHGWHLIVKIRQRLTLAEIIAAQAILGSDRDRERLNLARAISVRLRPSKFWKARANLLYSRKLK